GRGAGGGLAVPPQGHGLGQVGELAGVGDLGDIGDGGGGPAVGLVVPSGQAELLGAGLVLLVVVAALAGGVLDVPGVGQGVGGFVQQRAEDVLGGAAQSFTADHDFGVLLAVDVPPAG